MSCKQLGGACAKEFHADTFEEIAEMNKWFESKRKEFNDLPES
jgi:hypothetical protein